MKTICPFLLAVVFCLMGSALHAQGFSLTERELQTLKPEALESYRKAMHALDHVLNEKALSYLQEAQKADPDHVAIRLLTAKLAISEGRKAMGEQALGFFRIAEGAFAQILEMPLEAVKPSERKRAEEGVEQARDFIIKQAERDARRVAVGKDIVLQRAKELYPEKKKTATPTPEEAAATASQGQQQMPAGMPPMMMDPSMMGIY